MLTAPFVPDQVAVVTGPVITNLTTAQVATAFAGSIRTPTANFSMRYRDVTIQGTAGVPIVVDAGLAAALAAAGAPVV